jgi:large subunit ribosomal protein L32e
MADEHKDKKDEKKTATPAAPIKQVAAASPKPSEAPRHGAEDPKAKAQKAGDALKAAVQASKKEAPKPAAGGEAKTEAPTPAEVPRAEKKAAVNEKKGERKAPAKAKKEPTEKPKEKKREKHKARQKPELTPEVRRALEHRRVLKDRTPYFLRQESYNYGRVADVWRRPRGTHSKLRHHFKARINVVSIGYGGPNLTKGMHPSGYKEVLIHHPRELDRINPKVEAARVAHGVGARKREMIEKRADRMGIRILNKMS